MAEIGNGAEVKLKGKKIAVLIESDFYEKEIFYYQHRFPEEGVEVHFLSRLWNQDTLTFKGHEYHIPFECRESFENMDDATLRSFSAIIVPSAMVSDRLRYTEDIHQLPPATRLMKRAFAEKDIIKGIICHGMWLLAPVPERMWPQGRGPQQPARGCPQHGRGLHGPGRGSGRGPGDGAHRDHCPSFCAHDHRHAGREVMRVWQLLSSSTYRP